jgi:hypothetical protein
MILDASNMEATSKTAVQTTLVLYTAVDHLHRGGAGIGITQHAECTTVRHSKKHRLPAREAKYSICGQDFQKKNIKTAPRAEMLAMQHALGLARSTIKEGIPRGFNLQWIKLFSEAWYVVQLVNHHRERGPKSLSEVTSTNDREMIKRVLSAIKKVSRLGLDITISVAEKGDRAGAKVRTLARQKGCKSRRSRHRMILARRVSRSAEN